MVKQKRQIIEEHKQHDCIYIKFWKKTKLNIVSRRDIFKVVKLKEKANKLLFKG